MATFKLPLTEMPLAYTGKHMVMEIMPSDDVVYLQRVNGCGYDVNTLTPEQAILLGQKLIESGQKVAETFAASTAITVDGALL